MVILQFFKSFFSSHLLYFFYRIINDPSNSKLMNALSSHCQYIPPIEEAFNGLQEFLHEEFPKLIKEIQFHTQSTLQKSVSTKEKNVPINSHGHSLEESQGLFAVLPVQIEFFILFVINFFIPST